VEGYSTFRRSGIDLLASGRYLVAKKVAQPVGLDEVA